MAAGAKDEEYIHAISAARQQAVNQGIPAQVETVLDVHHEYRRDADSAQSVEGGHVMMLFGE